MKHICIISTSLEEEQRLMPLISELKNDSATVLTHVSACRHQSRDLTIHYNQIQEQGRGLDEAVAISLHPDRPYSDDQAPDMAAFSQQLRDINPDLVLVAGDSFEAFSAATAAATILGIPVAHIGGGETFSAADEPSYAHVISKLACLNFTTTEMYRWRVVGEGKHPDQVRNVGHLALERLRQTAMLSWTDFTQSYDMDLHDRFILVSLAPDRALGSANASLVTDMLDALSDPALAEFKLLFHLTENKGLGKIICSRIREFASSFPDRCRFIVSLTSADGLSALGFCTALIGNSSQALVEGASLKVPAVNLGNVHQYSEKARNVIDAESNPAAIGSALETAVSPEFRQSLHRMSSPYEKGGTTHSIQQVLRTFSLTDLKA